MVSPPFCVERREKKSSEGAILAVMKLLSVPAVALFSLLAPVSVSAGTLEARAPSFYDFSQSAIKLDDKTPVEGSNPLVYCSNPATNSLQIDSVDLTPNPPQAYVLTAHMLSWYCVMC